jgi:predicted  nucleic acid-binding Zn-ribbon protein
MKVKLKMKKVNSMFMEKTSLFASIKTSYSKLNDNVRTFNEQQLDMNKQLTDAAIQLRRSLQLNIRIKLIGNKLLLLK